MKGGIVLNLDQLTERVKNTSGREKTFAVAHATDKGLFEAARRAMDEGIGKFVFVGPTEVMAGLAEEAGLKHDGGLWELKEAADEKQSAAAAVSLVKAKEADVLMKGMTSTSVLLKAVLNKEHGLRSGSVLSHVAAFDLPGRDSLLLLTDAAMNIAPDLKEKTAITVNAVETAKKIGFTNPKVAVIAAVETVNPAMEATLHAAALTQMNRRGQIPGCIIDGPLAFDLAVSKEAAEQKGIHSEVAGEADILVVPAIETGNALYKSLTIFGKGKVGGLITGAGAPIVLTSRADSAESKLFSITIAAGAAE
ncbi:phosphate butyryltransferase [Alteribacter lacisalsi]|uniref:Phosphate butyryltransferase n=1 Tax=Alteribacter lacisalsi TaxID=2045244 RepID=A0A2W0HCH5_9BACI|nr:bifunctional enoyl-CoA hydratase/phosphate acetyltransferase [Alteribacter lacisalsi]PYZ98561.1 phosphate butyryltransferase [Alteribacter lacisalsi]